MIFINFQHQLFLTVCSGTIWHFSTASWRFLSVIEPLRSSLTLGIGFTIFLLLCLIMCMCAESTNSDFFSGSAAIVLHACSQCNACVQQVVCCMSQASELHFCSQCEHVCSKCTACLQQVHCMSAASVQHICSQCAACLQPVMQHWDVVGQAHF